MSAVGSGVPPRQEFVESSLDPSSQSLIDLDGGGDSAIIADEAGQPLGLGDVLPARLAQAFVSMQNQYNLLRRQDEPELMAMCADMGVGAVPYSPQGKGRLARPWGDQSYRSTVDHVVQSFDSSLDEPVVNAVQCVSEAGGATMAQLALAWVLKNTVVSAPIVGATKPHHLPEATAALDLHLTDEEIESLEQPYTPRAVLVLANPLHVNVTETTTDPRSRLTILDRNGIYLRASWPRFRWMRT